MVQGKGKEGGGKKSSTTRSNNALACLLVGAVLLLWRLTEYGRNAVEWGGGKKPGCDPDPPPLRCKCYGCALK